MKTILFDLDDTLIESMDVWEKAVISLFEYLQIDNYDFDELKERFKKMKFSDVLCDIHHSFQTQQDEKQMFDYVKNYVEDQYKNKVPAKKGALQYMKQCREKNIQMAVLTSNSLSLSKAALERLGMMSYLESIYSAEELHLSKQGTKIYQYALNDLKSTPEETTVFEDSYYAIEVARSLGIDCIGLQNEENREIFEKNKVPMIRDFMELL